MTDKWVTDPATGEGRAVPMTAAEQAEFDAYQAMCATEQQAEETLEANAATMSDRAAQAIGQLENAAQNWSTLTAAQKDTAMKVTVQVVARLARLVLRKLDTAT